jgi:hypothetical protein
MLWKYKKCYQETNEDITNPVSNLVSGGLSSLTTNIPEDACSTLVLDSFIYINQQVSGSITNGDIVYIDATATTTFIGNGDYYKLKAIDSQPHIVTIDSDGVVANNYAMCF